MLVNEVCKECKLTKKAVEYYIEQGLIAPSVRENGYGDFSDSDIARLRLNRLTQIQRKMLADKISVITRKRISQTLQDRLLSLELP